jgi:hypothetical protein
MIFLVWLAIDHLGWTAEIVFTAGYIGTLGCSKESDTQLRVVVQYDLGHLLATHLQKTGGIML